MFVQAGRKCYNRGQRLIWRKRRNISHAQGPSSLLSTYSPTPVKCESSVSPQAALGLPPRLCFRSSAPRMSMNATVQTRAFMMSDFMLSRLEIEQSIKIERTHYFSACAGRRAPAVACKSSALFKVCIWPLKVCAQLARRLRSSGVPCQFSSRPSTASFVMCDS